jgi:hypothetical protein
VVGGFAHGDATIMQVALTLEHELSNLVNEAYRLTPEETLMWQTARATPHASLSPCWKRRFLYSFELKSEPRLWETGHLLTA